MGKQLIQHRKIIFLLVLVLIASTSAVKAQQGKKEDVVFLRNESVIRGTILSRDSSRIRIQTAEGNVWVFNTNEVVKLSREWNFGSYQNRKKGFAHFTELGPLVAGKTTIDGVTTAAFSFQTVNGYRFSQYAFTGGGLGVDLYATQTIIPLFVSFRGDLSSTGSLIPFYFADAGYGINITQNSGVFTDFNGGYTYAIGLGAKIPFNKKAGFLMSFGYRHQATAYRENNLVKDVNYNRLAIRAGFFL